MSLQNMLRMIDENIMDDMSTSSYDVLSSKTFKGVSKIKVEMIRFNNDFRPIVKVSSLEDPNINGYVEYSSKIEAIQAYNNISHMKNLMKYISNYTNEPNSMKWAILLRDEGEEVKGSLISASTPGGLVPETTPSFGGGAGGTPPMPEAAPEAPPGAPPGTELPPPTPETTPLTPPAGGEIPAEPEAPSTVPPAPPLA
jgi:hypothetical protein